MTQRAKSYIGRVLASRYRIIARLGEGTLSEVMLARHVLIDRMSAIKILSPELAARTDLRAQFLHEARAVNRIHHPNIVEITDYGESDGIAFLVMEYVPGESLQRLLSQGPLGVERGLHLALKLSLALSRAHEMSVIHCDIRPSNVLVVAGTHDDTVKLTDFGAARLSRFAPLPPHHEASLAYVAPEGAGTEGADLYAVGVVLYEAIAGALPHDPSVPLALRPGPEPLADRGFGVSDRLDHLLSSLLARDPRARPRDAHELGAALRAVIVELEPGPDSVPIPLTLRDPPKRSLSQAGRMLTMPFDRIAQACESGYERLTAAETFARFEGRGALDELMAMVRRLGEIVLADTHAIAEAEARATEVREGVGAQLDELGRARSKILGWAVAAAEESERVRSQRLSGTQRTSHADALLWEEATLDVEEERSFDRAREIESRIARLSAELREANDRFASEHETLSARLEGHVAALRAISSEAWQALEHAGDRLGVALRLPGQTE